MSDPAKVLVVAAAIIDSAGRLLAARRSAPPSRAGGWELPGGKVDPGESDEQALVREIAEELGVAVRIGDRIGDTYPLGADYELHVYLAEIVDGEPEPLEDHDQLRWLDAGEWWSVVWLDADRPVIEALERLR